MTRYEKSNRNQKENRTKEIATILNVSVNAIKKYDFRNLIDLFYTLLWLEELFPNYDLDLYYYKDRSIICAYYSDYYLLNDTSYDNKNKKISKVFKYYEEDSMDCINYCVDNFFRITCEKLLTFIYLMNYTNFNDLGVMSMKMQKLQLSEKKMINNIMSHFFTNKENIEVYESDLLVDIITYEDFIKQFDNIEYLLRRPPTKNNQSNKNEQNKFDIKRRFNDLYKDNDKINNYLRSLNIKKIVIFGSLKEMLSNHIDMYGNDFEIIIGKDINDFYNSIGDNTLIIDTDSEICDLKKKLYNSYNLINGNTSGKLLSLEELCENSEYYYFVNTIATNPKINISILEFPNTYELENLTDDEKSRIEFDHLYRYYYERYKTNPYIDSILRKVFGELYSDEFILSRNYMPNVYIKSGRCFLENSDNPYCGSNNGMRNTTDQIYDYNFNINFFGPCLIFGALSDDSRTICSYLQRQINEEKKDYRVNNYGARAIAFIENVRSFDAINLFENDQCIFVVNQEEKKKLMEFGFDSFIDLKPVFEDPTLRDYFIDEPVHCNHVANEKIANYVYEHLKNKLLTIDLANSELANPIIVAKKKNVFSNNAYLNTYLEFLRTLPVTTDNNGCILMNCNPFTYGHYRLIEYASSQVPTLYVFVVQENKSYFDFQERFEMVKEGCKNFPNVIVVPSGKIFASAMLFPEYFNKEDNPDVSIDVSLDRELFTQHIAPLLNIKIRFVGEENVDLVTRAYNMDIKKNFPLYGIKVIEIPRFREDDKEISAKNVRQALEKEDWETVEKLVPETTLKVLKRKPRRK